MINIPHFAFDSDPSTARHGLEHYTTEALWEVPRDSLRPQHLLRQPRILSPPQHAHLLIRHPPLSNLPTAIPVPSVPWTQYLYCLPSMYADPTICPGTTQIPLPHRAFLTP